METFLSFLEYKTMRREPPPGHALVEVLFAEIDRRKVAEVVRGSRHKKNASATHFSRSLRNP